MNEPRGTDVISTGAPVLVYGTSWCPDCHRTRRFLDQHGIPYQWIDPEKDTQAMARLLQINHGMRSVPTLVFPDGTTLTEPSNGQLVKKLGV